MGDLTPEQKIEFQLDLYVAGLYFVKILDMGTAHHLTKLSPVGQEIVAGKARKERGHKQLRHALGELYMIYVVAYKRCCARSART